MGMHQSVYAGPFVELLDAKVTITVSRPYCPSGHKLQREIEGYCPKCGAQILTQDVQEQRLFDADEFLESELGDEDLFMTPPLYERVIFISNRHDQGGLKIDDQDDVVEGADMLSEKGSDWDRLCTALGASNLRYKRTAGIVSWWS